LSDRDSRRRGFEIGELEAEVLGVLNRLGSASAGELAEQMQSQRAIAYTTVSTTLDRLYRKGLVGRGTVAGRTGPKHVYSSTSDPSIERQVVEAALGKLVDAFGPSVTSAIYDRLSEISPDEVKRMQDEVARRRRSDEPP